MKKYIVTFTGSADVTAKNEEEAIEEAGFFLFGDSGKTDADSAFQLMSVEEVE